MRTIACWVWIALAACGGSKDEGGGGGGGTSDKASVLAKLDSFKPVGEETYDFVKKSNDVKEAAKKAGQEPPSFTRSAYELPPTPASTLASDVRMLAFYDLGKGKLDAKAIDVEPVKQVLTLYTKLSAGDLRGLRPKTHQAFVKTLSDGERDQLATELVAHIKDKGFLGADKLGNDAPPPMSDAAKVALGGGGGGATAAKPVDAPPSAPVFAGKYKTTEGAMTLYQRKANPTNVDGIYAKGQIACNATGDQLDCAWMEGSVKGRAKFTRDASGNMKGTWGKGQASSGGGPWNCTLVAAGVIE